MGKRPIALLLALLIAGTPPRVGVAADPAAAPRAPVNAPTPIKPESPQAKTEANSATPTLSATKPDLPGVKTEADDSSRMTFNFQDADIQAVVRTFSHITGRNFLLDPRVKGKLTIISTRPVVKRVAYDVLLSALRAQGFSAWETMDGMIRILPEAEARQNAPLSSGKPAAKDQWVSQVVEVQNASATQLMPIVRPLLSANAQVAVYAPANVLVLTDYSSNLRNAVALIERIDQPAAWEVAILPLKFASAVEVAAIVGRLDPVVGVTPTAVTPGQPAGAAGSEPRLHVVPDARTNSLIVRADNPGRIQILRSLVEKLDVEARSGGTTRVVYLRNADAPKMAELMRNLISNDPRAGATSAGGAPTTPSPLARSLDGVSIQSDEATNALIINAPDNVFNNLRAVIDMLDIRRSQIYVEALVAEVSSDKVGQLGIQWAAGNRVGGGNGQIGGGTNFPVAGAGIVSTATAPAATLANASGLTLGFLHGTVTLPDGTQILGLGALARALESDSRTNILSTPNLLTLDNSEAKIVIGQNVPFLTGRFSQATGTGSTVNPFQTIERKDVGLTLRIKPQISEAGGIKLQIYQEVSSVAPSNQAAQDIVTNKRSLETTVVVDDRSIVVLGGLIEDRVTDNVQEVPFLGRIPILGALFRSREKRSTKTNLMVFIRPVVVRGEKDAASFTESLYGYMRRLELESGRTAEQNSTYAEPAIPELVPGAPFKPLGPDAAAPGINLLPPPATPPASGASPAR
jgi:general secretion pathway protein D